MTEPKITANRRVVVIGASSTALACLEGLVFTPYLNLTSLTLVSPDGIPSAAVTATAGGAKHQGMSRRSKGGGGGEGGGGWSGGDAEEAKHSAADFGEEFDGIDGGAGGGTGAGAGGGLAASLSPVDEDAPDADRMARLGLKRHVRVVR